MSYSILDLKLRFTDSGVIINTITTYKYTTRYYINKALFFVVNFRCLSVWNNSERKLIFFPTSESGSLYGPPRLNGTNNFYTAKWTVLL